MILVPGILIENGVEYLFNYTLLTLILSASLEVVVRTPAFLQMAWFPSFSGLNNIPLYVYSPPLKIHSSDDGCMWYGTIDNIVSIVNNILLGI